MPSRAWVVTITAIVCSLWEQQFQCPHGLELLQLTDRQEIRQGRFQCPHGLELLPALTNSATDAWEVSMPSRAWIVTPELAAYNRRIKVSMPSRAYTSFLLSKFRWIRSRIWSCFNALSGLYLISTVPLQKPRFYAVSRACFCRYLSEYSDNSRFSCMLTFWTYLMRCTYPRHCIKYSTKYNRCHPIFSLSW